VIIEVNLFTDLVKEICRLHQLWTERIKGHIRRVVLPVPTFWKNTISLPDGIVKCMCTYCLFNIAMKNLNIT
jgi:hypothetical protein